MTTPTTPARYDRFAYDLIPTDTLETLDAYVQNGRETGGFLRALLAGDLFNAVARADDRHVGIIPVIVAYLYNKVPAGAYGSYERYTDWTHDGGLKGREAK